MELEYVNSNKYHLNDGKGYERKLSQIAEIKSSIFSARMPSNAISCHVSNDTIWRDRYHVYSN